MPKIQHKIYFVIVFMAITCGIAYIVCGNDIIVRFGERGRGYQVGMTMVILTVSLLFSSIFWGRFDFDRKISDFSWRDYWIQFGKRYHCNKIDLIVLSLVVVLGGILRIVGCNWGLTSIFHPDEWNFVHPAMEMAVSESAYQTSTFFYPAQFSSKIVAVFIGLYSKYTGTEIVLYRMPEAFFIYRVFVAMTGTATILLCFLIGNFFRKHLGAIMAVLVAVYPVYIWQAKQATGDIVVFFCLSLTMLFSLRYMEGKRRRFLFFMTMGAAMATLEKWHGAIGIGYTGVIILLNSRRVKEFIFRGLYAFGTYMAWLLLLAPNVVFHLKTAVIDGFLSIAVWDGQKGPPYYSMLYNYGKFGIQHYCGIIYILVIAAGGLHVIHNFDRRYMISLMGILKIFILCLMNRQYIRWGMELYFVEIMLVSIGIWQLMYSNEKQRGHRIVCMGVTFVILLDFLTGSMVITAAAACSENDTRLIQEKECVMAGITPDNSISAWYTGFVPGGITNISWGWVQQGTLNSGLFIKDGQLYRTLEELEYAILNVSDIREPELVEAVRKGNQPIFSYDAEYLDVFWGTVSGLKWSWNDIVLISENIQVFMDICHGALLGRDIEVYDIRDIPYIDANVIGG